MKNEPVVYLAFRNNDTTTEGSETLACATCRNKAWTAVYDAGNGFPRLICTCCQQNAGRFGWVHDEETP